MASQPGTTVVEEPEVYVRRLETPDLKVKLATITELRDVMENIKELDYELMLSVILPVLVKQLDPASVTFHRESGEQRVRHAVLDLLHRLPHNEAFRQYANDVFALMIKLLRNENEENGVLCMKVIIDLTRMYKASLEPNVRGFLSAVHEMYVNGLVCVDEIFGETGLPPQHFPWNDTSLLPSAMYSFKVLIECPIAIVLVLQTFRGVVNEVVRTYLPDVANFMTAEAPAQKRAHEEAESRGERFVGMAPGINIKHRGLFVDLVTAQIKSMSFLAYVLRASNESLRKYEAVLPALCVRLMQDAPGECATTRKELLVAIRHILSTDFKINFKNQIDALLDERILVGTGAAAQESLRPLSYSMLADLIHHIRMELTLEQIESAVRAYSVNLQNLALAGGIGTMCAKLLLNLVDPLCKLGDKLGDKASLARILLRILESCVQKMKGLETLRFDLAVMEQDAVNPDPSSRIAVERAKPFGSLGFVHETVADARKEARFLVRCLLHGVRAVLQGIRMCEGPPADAGILGPLFQSTIRSMAFYTAERGDNREEKEILEWFGFTFTEMDPHVVQEVWTTHMDFFCEQTKSDPTLLALVYKLTYTESLTHQMVSILLRYLVDRFDSLGEQDKTSAGVTLKLFKISFQATAQFPAINEKVLLPHLAKLIMDSFPLAAKATEPMNYFLNLRNLFRSIGGGRFESLYHEVLPLLQEMLESFNQFIDYVDPSQHDLLVELALTVPVRLTHLLPHLGLLMRPLVAGLNAGPELVAQALRTLELCVDNLTADFLEPIIRPTQCELMAAIHRHLKPVPYDHKLSHVCARILGKLGGRNRRIPELRPPLPYRTVGDDATIPMSFDGQQKHLEIGPAIELAVRTLQHTDADYRQQAFTILKECAVTAVRNVSASVTVVVMPDGALQTQAVLSAEQTLRYDQTLSGLFDAVKVPDLRPSSTAFIRDLARYIFEDEARKKTPNPTSSRRIWGSVIGGFYDALAESLACAPSKDRDEIFSLVKLIVEDMDLTRRADPASPNAEYTAFLMQLAARFVGLCYQAEWFSKLAGFTGLTLLTSGIDLGADWIQDRQIEFIQAMLSVLKETPYGAPQYVRQIVDGVLYIARIGHADGANPKTAYITGRVMVHELASPNAQVRQAAQSVLQLYAELENQNVTELLRMHRDRMLTSIYQKPLRALPFPTQIGHIDAMTYCLNLRPPLVEVNDELIRLLSEALALADADDLQLLGKTPQRKNVAAVTELRVVCIKLLTSSMSVTDFMAKQTQTRQRVTGVYFKSLYSASREVKTVAYEGLRLVLAHQNKLPKDTLQAGLKPILMNLADARRLTVPNLEGLARLLELLTNYFKVEIGIKLIDHFRVLAEPHMLRDSAFFPLDDNDDIKKLVRLINVFHLLPQTANMFLEKVLELVVQTETALRAAGPTPFTEPLSKYMERFPVESFDLLLRNISDYQFVRTVRSCVKSGFAPTLRETIDDSVQQLIESCFQTEGQEQDLRFIIPGLLLCQDMLMSSPRWVVDKPELFEVLRTLWRSFSIEDQDRTSVWPLTRLHQDSIMIDILLTCLQQEPSVSLLLDLMLAFTRRVAVDVAVCSRVIYDLLVQQDSAGFKRDILEHFLVVMDDPSLSMAHKAQFIRLVVNPVLELSLHGQNKADFIDLEFINRLHEKVWHSIAFLEAASPYPPSEPVILIELLHLSSLLIQLCPHLMAEAKKDLVKMGWYLLSSSEDTVLKNTAYIFLARFLDLFEAPPKIVMRVWSGLIHAHSPDGRKLATQAMDIIVPALPRRMPEPNPSTWARAMRRVLIEETNSISQLMTIYNLVIRHADIFYPSRELFVPHMVNSLFKIGLTNAPENRLLSVEVAELLVRWEARYATEAGSSVNAERDRPESERTNTWMMPPTLRETVLSFLIRFLCSAPEPILSGGLPGRLFALLKQILNSPHWRDVQVMLNFFTRILSQLVYSVETAVTFRNTAVVLAAVSDQKPSAWFRMYAHHVQEVSQKAVVTDDTILHDSLEPVVDGMFHALPEPSEDQEQQHDPASVWYAWAENTISEGIRTATGVHGALFLLRAWSRIHPEKVDGYGNSLMKLMGKLAHHHVTTTEAAGTDPAPDTRLMCSMIELYRERIAFLPEARRTLFNILSGLVDKSNSPFMCRAILDVARKWVFDRADGSPPLKDCAALLYKMIKLEQKSDHLLATGFLNLVYDIYTEPSLLRTDVTVRLEPAFVLGCRHKDAFIRTRFLDLLDSSLPRSLPHRLQYVFASTSWDFVSDSYWLHQALDLILSAADDETASMMDVDNHGSTGEFDTLIRRQNSSHLLNLVRRLVWLDEEVTHRIWLSSFKSFWQCLSRRAQSDMVPHIVGQLSQQYHRRQAGKQPNVIQTFLGGFAACSPPLGLPPHLIKYLGKTFNVWHDAIEQLQSSLDLIKDDDTFHEGVLDCLAELYAELSEDDLFYGVWRRRSVHVETNMALSFEQNGFWKEAAMIYEHAQMKGRAASLPSAEMELCLWEDHWILASQKLASWEVLYDFSRAVNDADLLLECAWRLNDWSTDREQIERAIEAVSETPTPRRSVFEQYLYILKIFAIGVGDLGTFNLNMEKVVQLTLRKWAALPEMVSSAHIPLLHHFQQLVELQESQQIFQSIATTGAQNLEKKSAELKVILQGWRERLPNAWDDIQLWSDLVAWRQHMFGVINKAYLPLIPHVPSTGAATANSNTFGYRGYHEMAWIINRFAHVARKHELWEVCHTSLTKIYTLPNIEISEAFLKLREQARCHFQRHELNSGLEVINNTNLIYFSAAQKAEFFTMKGMFIDQAGNPEEAYSAFSQAVKTDMNLPKAWAEWGRFCDRLYRTKGDVKLAAHAVTSYLQAAGMFKSTKARPLLARVLWLLRLDDTEGHISAVFDTHRGEFALWWWIHLIPQLLMSLSQHEGRQARALLIQLAKFYPQALFFHLRTARDEEIAARAQKEQAALKSARAAAAAAAAAAQSNGSPASPKKEGAQADDAQALQLRANAQGGSSILRDDPAPGHGEPAVGAAQGSSQSQNSVRQSWEYIEEITSILKTAFPLLALTMESLAEQFSKSFRPSPEEDLMKYLTSMVIEGLNNWTTRNTNIAPGSDTLPSHTHGMMVKFAQSLPDTVRAEFVRDFIETKPSVREYLGKLLSWRDRYERLLDARPKRGQLEVLSHHLAEFQHLKYDDIEVPGQYLKFENSNAYFVKITRFKSTYELAKGAGSTFKRVTMVGSNGAEYGFMVQHGARPHNRREERITQLFRTLSSVLDTRKETKKRGISFYLPGVVPVSHAVRLVEHNASIITFQDISDEYMAKRGWTKEHAIVNFSDKMRENCLEIVRSSQQMVPDKASIGPLRMVVYEEIKTKIVPENIMSNYFNRTYPHKKDLWAFRKQFTLQMATCSFLTYAFSLQHRSPARFSVARATGNIFMVDTLPNFTNSVAEGLPFRLSPNIVHFMTPNGTEGILPAALLAVARAVAEPDYDLELTLGLYIRDEVAAYLVGAKTTMAEEQFHNLVGRSIADISARVDLLSCKMEREKAEKEPRVVTQTITELISKACNALEQAKASELMMPWF